MTAHHDVTPEMIRAAAKRTGTSEIHVRKALLGLIPDEHGVVAALVAHGVDEAFLNRLRGLPRKPTGQHEAA